MPKASRIRHGTHQSSVKLPQAPVATIIDDIPPTNSLNTYETGIPVGQLELGLKTLAQQSKKAKQLEKREAFLQKLEPSTRQTSKSHERRLKRKAKEQLTGGLDDLQSAIASLEQGATLHDESLATNATTSKDEKNSRPVIKPGTIGKGGSSTLSKAQRKRVLELERLRHPLILTNSEFSSNPFQTIRTHAQNTLLTENGQK